MAEADEDSSSQQCKKPPWHYLDVPSSQGPTEELNNFIQVLKTDTNIYNTNTQGEREICTFL